MIFHGLSAPIWAREYKIAPDAKRPKILTKTDNPPRKMPQICAIVKDGWTDASQSIGGWKRYNICTPHWAIAGDSDDPYRYVIHVPDTGLPYGYAFGGHTHGVPIPIPLTEFSVDVTAPAVAEAELTVPKDPSAEDNTDDSWTSAGIFAVSGKDADNNRKLAVFCQSRIVNTAKNLYYNTVAGVTVDYPYEFFSLSTASGGGKELILTAVGGLPSGDSGGDVPITDIRISLQWYAGDQADIRYLAPVCEVGETTWVSAPQDVKTGSAATKITPMLCPQIVNGWAMGSVYLADPPKGKYDCHAAWTYAVVVPQRTAVWCRGPIGGNTGTLEGSFLLPWGEAGVEIIGGADCNCGSFFPGQQPEITDVPQCHADTVTIQPYSRVLDGGDWTYNNNLIFRDALYSPVMPIGNMFLLPASALAGEYETKVPWTVCAYDAAGKGDVLLSADVPGTSAEEERIQLGPTAPKKIWGAVMDAPEEADPIIWVWCIDPARGRDDPKRCTITPLMWLPAELHTPQDTSGMYVDDGVVYAKCTQKSQKLQKSQKTR